MWRVSAFAVICTVLPVSSTLRAQNYPTTIATVGDSFADSIFLAMKARPAFLQQHDIKVIRWSRPIIGLSRDDYFDYPGWLTTSNKVADVCVIQIGSNDMQSLHKDGKYFFFGTDQWKEVYLSRAKAMVDTLAHKRCKQILWMLQPGFERQQRMAEKHVVVNELQSQALQASGSMAFELTTNREVYGSDNTHFNRDYMLKLGDAILSVVAESKPLIQNRCFSCHSGFDPESISHPLNRHQGRFVRLALTNAGAVNPAAVDDGKQAPPKPSLATRRRSAGQKLAGHPAGGM